MSVIAKITSGLKLKYRVYSILCPLTMIGEVVLESILPYLLIIVIDKGVNFGNKLIIIKYSSLMVLCSCFSLLFGFMGSFLGSYGSQGFSHNLRTKLFNKIQSFSFRTCDKYTTASLVTRLTTDITNVNNVYQLMIRIAFRAPFMLIIGSYMAYFINPRLSLVFLVELPLLSILIALISILSYRRFGFMLKRYDRLNTIVQENLVAIRTVKAFVRGGSECEKFNEGCTSLRNAQRRAEKLIVILPGVMQGFIYISVIFVLYLGGKEVIYNTMALGELVSFLSYIAQILMSLMMIGMIFVSFVLSRASLARILEVLDEDGTEESSGITDIKDYTIRFNNVNFGYYEDSLVLKSLNLSIQQGMNIGIVGATGSSKTTFVSLISRLYDVLEGEITIGGINIKDYDLATLRDKVGVVLQKNLLFRGSIRDNLRWGNENATDEEIWEVLKVSEAYDFVMEKSEALDTYVEQGGTNLSGGQRQRLCIARALLKKPCILIFDDSTSSVDSNTERRIQNNLKEYLPSTTKITISQRLSSIIDMDKIIVLDQGFLSGYDTHSNLLKNNEIYKEVYESQGSDKDADL